MKRKLLSFLLVFSFLTFGFISVSEATTTIYSGSTAQSSFLSAINSSYYYNDFSNITTRFYGFSPMGFGPVSGFSYTMSASEGLCGTNGAMTTNSDTDPLIITFTGDPVYAIGGNFWPTNFYGNNVTGDIFLSLSDGSSAQLTNANSGTFWGITSSSTPFTSISIKSTATSTDLSNQFPTVDNLYVGSIAQSPVPEPSTMLLLGFGLLGLAGVARKKMKA